MPALAQHGVHLRRWDDLTAGQQLEASAYFDAEISPALTPLVIDPVHPFPFLSNLSTSLVFLLHDPDRAEPMYARIKVPAMLRQWIPLQADVAPGHTLLVPLYEVIRGNVHKLYRGMDLTATTLRAVDAGCGSRDRRRLGCRLERGGEGANQAAAIRTGGAVGVCPGRGSCAP